MPNWERTPPASGMSIEEIKKRVADGITNRRKTGELRPEGLKDIVTKHDGPGFTKPERVALIRMCELAIYSLANFEALDYCQAAETIYALCKKAGFKNTLAAQLLKGIAQQAAELADDEPFEFYDQLARRLLADHFKPSEKTISIVSTPKGKTDGNSQKEPQARTPTDAGPGQ